MRRTDESQPTLARQLFEWSAYVLCVFVCCCAKEIHVENESILQPLHDAKEYVISKAPTKKDFLDNEDWI